MVFTGFARFAAFLADANLALPFTAGMVIEIVYLAAFVYLMLSFPAGRLATGLERGSLRAPSCSRFRYRSCGCCSRSPRRSSPPRRARRTWPSSRATTHSRRES